MVGLSKNKNTDNQGKESCVNESDQISLLRDSTMSSALNFCFYLFYCSAKEKDNIRRKNN